MDQNAIKNYLENLEKIHQKTFKNDSKYFEECKKNKANKKDYKIERGHIIEEYFNKYSKKLQNGKLVAFKENELWLMNKDTKYWEINNDSEFKYFEVPSKKIIAPLFVPNVVLFGLVATTLAFAGLFTWKALSSSTGGGNDDPVNPTPEPDPYDYVPTPTDSIAITAVNEEGAQIILRTAQASLQGDNALYKSSDDYYFEKIADTTDVTINLEYKESIYLYRPSTAAINTRLIDLEQGHGEIAFSGNIKSLIGNSATMPNNAFSYLFGGNNIAGFSPVVKVMSAKKVILPYMALSSNCYTYMFTHDYYLIDSPELPATTLANSCYSSMFSACSSLISAPDLPATETKDYCYSYMFTKCNSLTVAPKMIIDVGTPGCCSGMFLNCESLKEFPKDFKLAITISTSSPHNGRCFGEMFLGCTSLSYIPEDMLRTNEITCTTAYINMFQNCTGLTSIPAKFFKNITVITDTSFSGMFLGCTGIKELPNGLFSSFTSFYTKQTASFKAASCFEDMFNNCTSLETAPYDLLPNLPITSADNGSLFKSMFQGCSSLTSAPKLQELSSYPYGTYRNVFYDCASLNIGECNSDADIPSGGKKIISTPSSFDTSPGLNPFEYMFGGANCSFTSLDGQGTPNPSKTYYFY